MMLRQPASGEPAPRLQLLTREDCHLCHEMAALLDQLLPAHGLAYDAVDVDGDPELAARYGDTVPVLLRDGRPVAKARLTRRQLERILQRRRRWSPDRPPG